MTDHVQLSTKPPGGNEGLPAGLWPTKAARAVTEAADACHLTGQMGLVTGPSGIGKSTAARAAIRAAKDSDVNAFYISMTRAHEKPQPGLLRIAQSIGAGVQVNMGPAEIFEAILEGIVRWPEEWLLLLDEANFMSDDLLDVVRNLADELEDRRRSVGILLLGTPDLANRINGKVRGQTRRFEPLRGRLGLIWELGGLDGEDFTAVARGLGLPEQAAGKVLAGVGSLPGGMHNIKRLVTTAHIVAGAGNALSLSHLRTATQVRGGGA